MNVHVIAVYFPVGLLTASVIFDLLALTLGREELARAGWWTLVAGVLFGIAALVTGLLEKPAMEAASASARSVIDVHSTLAFVAIILFGILTLWRLVGRGRLSERGRPAYLAAAVIAAAILFATTYFGIRGVYVYAIGIPDATLEAALESRAERRAARGLTPPGGEPADTVPMPGTDTAPDRAERGQEGWMDTVPWSPEPEGRVDTVQT